MRVRLILVAVCALVGTGVEAGPFDLPKPAVFARAEDQLRARLLTKPCAASDLGHGCYRINNRLVREVPCVHLIDVNTVGSLPTDQCYKMEKARRYRGVWTDEFEGQNFVPEGTTAPSWPNGNPRSQEWKVRAEKARAAAIWLDVDRVKIGHDFRKNGRKMLIEFIGRKTMYPGAYGHMGMSGNEIIVDRVISLKAIN